MTKETKMFIVDKLGNRIVKNIANNIVGLYENLGWKIEKPYIGRVIEKPTYSKEKPVKHVKL